MTIAHLGSRLAIKSCLPVDFKNTVFLAHYDITEEENLKGIRPVGNRYSLDFNGTDTYIKTSLNNPITQNSFTIECFVYTDVTNQSKVIAGQFDSFGLCLTSGKIKAVIWDNDWVTTYTLPTGRWVHVAFTFDGAIYSLYFDGILQGTYSHPTSVPVKNSHPFTIGAWSASTSENYFKGRISEVRLWNYARTSSEINSCMNKHLTGAEPGLVGYWKLNEGTGSIVLDYSSNAKHGKINGGVSWVDGQLVFTLRPSEGKYGGCIVVEEATTNLVTNPTLQGTGSLPDNWHIDDIHVPYTTVSKDTIEGTPMWKVTVDLTGQSSGNGGITQRIYPPTISPGDTLTLTAYIFDPYDNLFNGIGFIFWNTDGSNRDYTWDNQGTKTVVNLGRGYKKVIHTGTGNPAKTLNYLEIRISI